MIHGKRDIEFSYTMLAEVRGRPRRYIGNTDGCCATRLVAKFAPDQSDRQGISQNKDMHDMNKE